MCHVMQPAAGKYLFSMNLPSNTRRVLLFRQNCNLKVDGQKSWISVVWKFLNIAFSQLNMCRSRLEFPSYS